MMIKPWNIKLIRIEIMSSVLHRRVVALSFVHSQCCCASLSFSANGIIRQNEKQIAETKENVWCTFSCRVDGVQKPWFGIVYCHREYMVLYCENSN